MFIEVHLAAGLILGKLTNNYTLALAGALAIDLDHLIPYINNKVIFDLKRFWKTITDPKDPYGNQRNFLHSFIGWIFVSSALIIFNFEIGFIFSLGYLSHLLLDIADGSDFYPFYPLSKINLKGPIKYFSKTEFIIAIILFVIFLIL